MRKTLIVLVIAVIGYWAYQHPDEVKQHSTKFFRSASQFFASLAGDKTKPDENSTSFPGTTQVVDGSGNPQTRPVMSVPPEGVYYLLQPVRVTSNSGSTLLPAGAWVKKAGEGNGKILITDGTGNAMVDTTMLTRDPAAINALAQRTQAEARSRMTAENAKVQQLIQEIDAKLSALRIELHSIRERDLLAAKTGTKVTFATTENFVQSNITMLEKRKAELLKQLPPPPPPAQ